ncbi:MAG: hypothetical protein O7A04_08155, partial [Acidobacteria bacterium]|nr:hypothetical protein [Acidobacteriota bacterium]
MPRCLIFSVLFLTCAGTLLSQDPDDERPGFSRPRRASGTQVVRAQEGSHPFDGDWPALAAVPLERSHYRWSAEYLDAARREAYVDADIGEGHRLGARQAASGPLSKAPPRGLTFDGLNRLTSAYLGIIAYPPDPNLAVSKTAIIQATNIAVRLTNRQGVEIDRQPLNNFLGFNSNSVLFDPKVYFDRLSGRFYVVALEQSESPRRSGIWIAVSKNGNPSALRAPQDFCTYRISGNRGGSWADYPTIGINEDWFAIGVNNFRFNDGGFRRAHVYVMAVDRITDNAQSCPTLGVKRFNVRENPDGEPVFGIHPAQHYNKNNFPGTPLFMVSAAFFLPSAQYTLWQITTGTAGAPMLSSQILTGDFSYSFAPAAPQRGGSDLDPGDPR